MIFTSNTILNARNNSFPVYEEVNESASYDGVSFFEYALDFITNESKEFASLFEPIEEGFIVNLALDIGKVALGKISIADLFANIFDAFVTGLQNLYATFKAFLLNFVNDSFELMSFKSKLMNYRGSIRYNKPYYEYKNLNVSTSYSTYQLDIEREGDDLMSDLRELGVLRSVADIQSKLEEMKSRSDYDASDLDQKRGDLLGTKDIAEDDFADALFEYFRTTTTPINPNAKLFEKNIGGQRVHEAAVSFFQASKQESQIKKDTYKMKSEADRQKARMKSVNPDSYLIDTLKLNPSCRAIYNTVISNKCKRVKSLCDMYCLMFAAKLDALKEYNQTNKNILLLACQQITREENRA